MQAAHQKKMEESMSPEEREARAKARAAIGMNRSALNRAMR